MKNYLSILGDKATKEQTESADIVTQAATNMSQLIRDLLDYSRCDWAFEKEGTNLNECVDDALENLAVQIKGMKANLTKTDLPTVLGSSLMLTQLFQNLIGNALKFTQDGTAPQITLTHSVENGEDVFGVKDHGIGFEPEKTNIIFQPFKRLNHDKNYDGNGIGLSTCQKIVQKHGGKLWVDTAPDQGAHFKFTLGNEHTQGVQKSA